MNGLQEFFFCFKTQVQMYALTPPGFNEGEAWSKAWTNLESNELETYKDDDENLLTITDQPERNQTEIENENERDISSDIQLKKNEKFQQTLVSQTIFEEDEEADVKDEIIELSHSKNDESHGNSESNSEINFKEIVDIHNGSSTEYSNTDHNTQKPRCK